MNLKNKEIGRYIKLPLTLSKGGFFIETILLLLIIPTRRFVKKILLVVIVLITGFMLFYLVKNLNNKDTKEEFRNTPTVQTSKRIIRPDDNIQHKYSMKQIDSISANLNYKFTKENKIPDSVSNPSADKNKPVKK